MTTLKQFNYFISIVEEGGFIAASEKLFIAQSALSRQMKLLEEAVGFPIFDRSGKKAKLTAAGQVLYQNIKNQIASIANSIAVAKSIADGEGRTLKIAHSSSIIVDQKKLNIFDQICQACDVNIEMNTLSSELQIESLLNGSIDLGFIRSPVFHPLDEINAIHLYTAPLFVAVQREDPFFQHKNNVQLSDLAEQNFVATPHAERGGLSYLAANLCLSRGFHPKKARIRSRKISQLELVAKGLGICIAPQEFQAVLPISVRLIELEENRHWSEVLLIWRQDHDPIIQRCAEIIIESF